jgi:hypothetical protein
MSQRLNNRWQYFAGWQTAGWLTLGYETSQIPIVNNTIETQSHICEYSKNLAANVKPWREKIEKVFNLKIVQCNSLEQWSLNRCP